MRQGANADPERYLPGFSAGRSRARAAPTPNGETHDEGYTGAGSVLAMLENPKRGTRFGIGASLDLYTQFKNPDGTMGEHRDDEARLYVLWGQQGASVRHIVDQLRKYLPWANISILSWEARAGAAGKGNRGGLFLQNALHSSVFRGGTIENHSLATQYPQRSVGPYFALGGYVGSRMGDGPLSVGVRAMGEVAPAGTSNLTTGVEAQLDYNDFYIRIGISGSVQKSALAEFDGSRQDGAYPSAFSAIGYQGDRGSGVEVRVSQNPQGTGLGLSALGDSRHSTASVMLRLTTESISAFLQKLCF